MKENHSLESMPLHDAVLDEIAVEWATRVCVMRLRGVGPDGGRPMEIRWRGLIELHAECEAPWGRSSSVLDARSLPDGVDEIRMQSGDIIRVRAEDRVIAVNAEALAKRYGELAADALADVGLIEGESVAQAARVAAEEIRARRGIGDV